MDNGPAFIPDTRPGARPGDMIVVQPGVGGEEWPEPLPLPELRPRVPAFEEALLPERLRPWLSDITGRMQCPPEFPAVGALVAIASLIGRQVGIRPKRYDDWLVVPNLWGAVVGRPGVLKTPALEEPLKPLHRLKHAAMDQHKVDVAAHEADNAAHEALVSAAKKALAKEAGKHVVDLAACRDAKGALSKQAEALRELQETAPTPPTMRRYITSDATPEKLGELLAENRSGILVYRDELVSWLRGLDREGREEGRGFYLQGWNGTGSYTFDRIVRGTVHIEAVCISILGGIQPGPLSDYVWHASHNGAGNDGLLQRFQLLVWPDDSGHWVNVDRWPDTEAKNTAFTVFERLNGINGAAIGADISEGIPFLRFSEEGQRLFDDWRSELERVKLRSGEPEFIEAHLAKYRSLAPSLALLFHLVDDGNGPVTAQAAARAFDWCEFLEAHARRVYGAATIRGLDSAHALATKIREGRLPAKFKPKDVYLKGWSRLDKDATYAAIEVLADSDWLRVHSVPTGGRPSQVVTLNPNLELRHG